MTGAILFSLQDGGTGNRSRRSSLHMNDTPRGSWASSIFDLKNSQADPLLPNFLDRSQADDIDHDNFTQRQQNRQEEIFALYPNQPEVRNV